MRERGLSVPSAFPRSAYNRKNVIPEIISESKPMSIPLAGANCASGAHAYLAGNSYRDLPPLVANQQPATLPVTGRMQPRYPLVYDQLASDPVVPPKNGTKQTFSQCMAAHANDFSIAGTLNHGFNAIFGTSLAVQNNFFAQAVFGNPITTVLYGSATDNAGTALSTGPTFVQMGMGTVTSYGRRTTTIMALNLAGNGGVPLALGAASGTKAAIGQVAKVAGGFMSLEATLAINAGFTAAEAAYYWSQP